MKYFLKGIGLGVSLNAVNLFCNHIFYHCDTPVMILSAMIFGIVITAFLVSDTISHLFVCGFVGLFTMFFSEIFIFSRLFLSLRSLDFYLAGLHASGFSIVIAIIMTVKHIKISDYIKKEGGFMNKTLKIKLILYALISAIGFSYLVLPANAGIGVLIFAVLQFVCLWFTVPNKRRLFLFIPILIMSVNCFTSANPIWRVSNFIISILLYGGMFIDFNFKTDSFAFITNTLIRLITSFSHFFLPFKWMFELNSDKAPVMKRIAIALVIAIPSAIVLITVLANADMVFSLKTESVIEYVSDFINPNALFKIMCGIFVGLFLFGLLYNAYTEGDEETGEAKFFNGDLIIINILLVTILAVYTLFVIIQFTYLFAGSTLPDGLTYTEYARKGFFELLLLTGVNIVIILSVIKLTKAYSGKWLQCTKILCHYLCAITIVLLVSSFYRMLLYTNDDGLTRLRFFVMGFLGFEAIGLIITFIYIAKPNFNIVFVYMMIALSYYTVLNVVPSDRIIAKNQIDQYVREQREELEYIFTLSADAAPAMEYLIENTQDEALRMKVKNFVEEGTKFEIPERWQRFNLSVENAKEILEKIE